MRRGFVYFLAIFSICLFSGADLAYAVDQSSANYKNYTSTFAPAVFDQSSANYRINAAVDPIVGYSNSANFNVRHGVPIKDLINPIPPPPPPPPPPPGGGGGGGGYYPPATTTTGTKPLPPGTSRAPTLIYRSPTFLSHQAVGGERYPDTSFITVNGSANGVKYLPNMFWERDLPLFIGYNEIRVQLKDNSGLYSEVIGGIIERMLIGDCSRPADKGTKHVVDDVDLSLFTRAWHKYNFYCDFNEDRKIDDVDLSLLASHWSMAVNY